MLHRLETSRLVRIVSVVGLALLCAAPALAGFEEQHSFSADDLTVRNLIGKVTVEGHGGSEFQVEVRVRGKDADRDRVRVETTRGTRAVLAVVFPLDETNDFVYPALGRGSVRTSIGSGDSGSWLGKLLGRGQDRIHVTGKGRGLEIWADIVIKAPRGHGLQVRHGVGDIVASGLDGDIVLDAHSGAVEVSNVSGTLSVDTGSGHVRVDGMNGRLSVDTGSGSVEITRAEGDRVNVDTGSGRVRLEGIRTGQLGVDTGSGRVEAVDIDADAMGIDTGSGSVHVELAAMGDGDFEIDTGSGRIELRLPARASARVRASTGNGGIDLDLSSDHEIRRKQSDEALVIVGGGAAHVDLDTGSGRIRVYQ